MTFIPLTNYNLLCRHFTGKSNVYWYDITNTRRGTLSFSINHYPFYLSGDGQKTESGTNWLFPYASSAEVIPQNTVTLLDVIGNSVISYAATNTGWVANITVIGTTEDTIRHILFTKKLQQSSAGSYESLIFAIKLDTPVELNAENNYTANFTFAIEF